MVLRANFAKTFGSENITPNSVHSPSSHNGNGGKHGAAPSFTSRIRSTITEAARRRRARTAGAPTGTKYSVEQARRRRSLTKSPATSIRFTVRGGPVPSSSPSSAVPIVDVEMGDATTTTTRPNDRVVTFPKELKRPAYREISRDVLMKIDPELEDVDIEYIREQLEECSPAMLRTLASVQADPVKDVLPKELSILIADLSFDAPTHMFGIYSNQPPLLPGKRKITLFPIHDIVFSTHCANLPHLPRGQGSLDDEGRITIPVIPLCLPSPQTFPALSHYLYTKSTSRLLLTLLPSPPPTSHLSILDGPSARTLRVDFARGLAQTYTTQVLLRYLMVINGVWRNVCALGVFCDEGLWDCLDVGWEVMLLAVTISAGDGKAMGALVGEDEVV